jgi:uncharacterized protein
VPLQNRVPPKGNGVAVWKAVDQITARWKPAEGAGLEHLVLHAKPGGYAAKSQVTGEGDEMPYAFTYEIEMDQEWRVLSLRIESIDGRILACTSPSQGIWHDARGMHLKELDGCIDVDFSFTCFTNTLPVRRTSFDKGQARSFRMLYVSSDSLDPLANGQRYTCIEPGRCFLYESIDGTFTREIEFDNYGLVRNYPGLYQRVD